MLFFLLNFIISTKKYVRFCVLFAQIQHNTKIIPFTCWGVQNGSFSNYNYC